VKALEPAARSLKVQLHAVAAGTPDEFAAAVSAAKESRAGALLVLGGSLFFTHRAKLAELAAKSRLPAMYGAREYVEAGGLMAYAPDLLESYRRAAGYVARILKGAQAGDLPIEQPTKFDLVINRRAVNALGLTIPPSVLAMGAQLIE
jgi:putative tryptophan/tyrosine transport system substrate-binding protein